MAIITRPRGFASVGYKVPVLSTRNSRPSVAREPGLVAVRADRSVALLEAGGGKAAPSASVQWAINRAGRWPARPRSARWALGDRRSTRVVAMRSLRFDRASRRPSGAVSGASFSKTSNRDTQNANKDGDCKVATMCILGSASSDRLLGRVCQCIVSRPNPRHRYPRMLPRALSLVGASVPSHHPHASPPPPPPVPRSHAASCPQNHGWNLWKARRRPQPE